MKEYIHSHIKMTGKIDSKLIYYGQAIIVVKKTEAILALRYHYLASNWSVFNKKIEKSIQRRIPSFNVS